MKFKKTMIWLLAIIITILGIFNLIAYLVSGPKYHGPVTDHFDGKVFLNPGGVKSKGLKDLIKWMRTREKQPWQPIENAAFGPKPATRVEEGITITFVNHSTFLIQTEGFNILTDPIWSDRTKSLFFCWPTTDAAPRYSF